MLTRSARLNFGYYLVLWGPRMAAGAPLDASAECGVTGGPNSLSLRIRSVADALGDCGPRAAVPKGEANLACNCKQNLRERIPVGTQQTARNPGGPRRRALNQAIVAVDCPRHPISAAFWGAKGTEIAWGRSGVPACRAAFPRCKARPPEFPVVECGHWFRGSFSLLTLASRQIRRLLPVPNRHTPPNGYPSSSGRTTQGTPQPARHYDA
jgi:hypothetical protein